MAAMSKMSWKVTSLAIALPLGFVARKVVAAGWRAVRHEEPPHHTDIESGWGEMLVWAAVSAVAIAATELVAVRVASAAYRSLTGNEPPGREPDVAAIASIES